MIRAFSILWLVVFVPIVLLIIPTKINPIQRLNEAFSEHFYQQIYSVNFELLSNKLLNQPNEQWDITIQRYATEFAYPLKLDSLSDYEFDQSLHESLHNGQVSFLYGDPMALIQRVGSSDRVIYFALNESTELAVLNQARGTLFLAAEHLRSLPKEEWDADLARQNQLIPFSIRLKTQSELSDDALSALKQTINGPVSYVNNMGQVELLAAIEPGLWLHVQDDLSQTTQLKLTSAIGVLFFLLISLALVLWIFPLWRDLKQLVATANEFGRGHLSRRAKACKMTVASQLSLSFNKMADNIENLIAGQRELTNAIAHDLRTPLYRLRFALEMLDDEQTSAAQREKYRRTIDSSIEDLDHLINQNLVLARYNRVADINQFSHCHFADCLKQEVEHFTLEHPNLIINLEVSQDLQQRQVFIDQNGLMRAVKNLLSNASRYAATTITLSFQCQHKHYVICVEDDGVGIAKTDVERVFEPFAQLENQERGSGKGHGLGLAIVKQIAHWHSGQVLVDDSSLGGAKFIIQWPQSFTMQPS